MKLSKIWGLPERQVLIYSMNKTEGETGSQNIGILPGPVFARNCVVWPQAGQFTFQMPLSCFLTCQRWSWFRKYLKSCAETRLLGHAGTHNFPHSLLLSMATSSGHRNMRGGHRKRFSARAWKPGFQSHSSPLGVLCIESCTSKFPMWKS